MLLPKPPLLVITDRRQAARPLPDIIADAVAAGCRWVSLREKDLPAAEQATLARDLAAILRPVGGIFTVHGTADLALASGADGVHLAAGSDVGAARAALGPGRLVGLSVHSAGEAAAAGEAPDYLVAGPFSLTASKPGYGPALGASGLAAVVRAAQVPVVAVGGIGPDEIAEVAAAGAQGVAVMGGVMRDGDSQRELLRDLMTATETRFGNCPAGFHPRPR